VRLQPTATPLERAIHFLDELPVMRHFGRFCFASSAVIFFGKIKLTMDRNGTDRNQPKH
jgi:hypothetical protein